MIGKATETRLYNFNFSNTAKAFDVVHTYARNGGYDVASLYDSAGDDRYYDAENSAKMFGPDNSGTPEFYVRAKLFESVRAFAPEGGYDRAFFDDPAAIQATLGSPASGDAFEAVFVLYANGSYQPI